MKRPLLALLLASAALAPSRAWAFGVDITWNDCVHGSTGAAATNQVFHCNVSDNRNYSLHFQYESPVSLPNFVAATAYVDLGPELTGGLMLSTFWYYQGGGCNNSGIKGAQMVGTIPSSCADGGYLEAWNGGANGTFAIAAYGVNFLYPGNGHFVLLGARGNSYPVNAGDSQWAFELRLNNHARFSCPGCWEPKVIVLSVLRLESNDGTPRVDLSGSDKLTDCVVINNASTSLCGIVPVETTTWGKIKALFR